MNPEPCRCCSCVGGEADTYCREHGGPTTRQCDEHNVPGVVDVRRPQPLSGLVSVQARLADGTP